MSTPHNVCIVKLGAIGDVVNCLPLLNRLRDAWPEARLSWVIAPLAHGLVRGHPAVDEFLELDVKQRSSWRPFVRELRSRRFDLVLDLQRILKSGLITRLSGAPRRMGFDRARCKELSWLFSNERLPANPHPGVTVAQYLEFADALGVPPREARWDLPLTAWPHAGPAVSLGIGASKPSNLWPLKRWSALIERLVMRLGAERIALVGGPQDRNMADALLASAPAGLVDTVGKLSLKASAGLIASSEMFVSCDTGPLHIAVATGTPVVALFGAADPLRTGPFGKPEAVLYEPADCSPCRKRECFVEGHPCMHNIEMESVFQRIIAAREASSQSVR